MRFSLAIAHTPWVPERAASMKRLQDSLNDARDDMAYEVFSDKEPNHVWSGKMWTWAASQEGVDWCVFLQDDAVVSPDFFARLEEIVKRSGEDVIGLQVAHPAAVGLAAEGEEGFTTTDALVGVGYAVNKEALKEFLQWRAGLPQETLEAITEDSLMGLWCAINGLKIYHPIPTIVDHDTTLTSTYDNGSHVNRRSRVRWDTPFQAAPHSAQRVPHMGCFYQATPHIAKARLGISDKQFLALVSDNGRREARRISFSRRAKGCEALAKVFVATPTRGTVNPYYAASVWRLLQDEAVDVEGGLELADIQQWSADVVRVRSRYVSYFLNQTDCTHLLFLDGDIEVLPWALRGMLAAKKDFVATPYPRRDGVDFKSVRSNLDIPAEGVAYRYPVHFHGDTLTVGDDWCGEIDAIGLGCALLSREGLQALSDKHAEELGFDDANHGPSVALFQLLLENRALPSEDYSFCTRWRRNGGRIWMYLGEGSPANHHGDMMYRGEIAAFGLRRV